ncbi:putative GTP diphosphokinase CRSH [Cucumis melo var. makuwa]|nr:guanosine-3'5'-bis(diphosphate) 3'-pyrophosphohydrolase [Cucumis melo subsp. melo]KAA0052146.1 putative GTP diphosphokinase CRSH [Cucumis melo var. makuwa]TYK05111.1 putative GTP diphosphokinase CRSH [Cucumis melo var. makuwa]
MELFTALNPSPDLHFHYLRSLADTHHLPLPNLLLRHPRRSLNSLSRYRLLHLRASSTSGIPDLPTSVPEQAGGKLVVELIGAFNELTDRMNLTSTSSSVILFVTLKLSIPILQSLPLLPDGRSPLSKALCVALILADLQMDAEVISAGILREVMEAGGISLQEVKNQIGISTAHLLHESLRVKHIPSRVDIFDDDSSAALRKFCLTYYDIRALILDLALKLDMMRNLQSLPRYQQQMVSLEVLKIHAPLAFAVGANFLSLQLEDLSFRYLFPCSYFYVDSWLRSHESGSTSLIETYKDQLAQSLKNDPILTNMVEDISVKGRYKSRSSTMKKLLKDGRKLEEVNDILGLRVILKPKAGTDMGERACYRACEIIKSQWKEIPHRTKDYIASPKPNGYKSLHMAVDVSNESQTKPLMEIQIRTTEMDKLAAGGTASHSLYKGGLTDPEEAKRLKAKMLAAAELAALRLNDFPSSNYRGIHTNQRGRVFGLLDKNGDGRISIEELVDVMEDLGVGAPGEDAREMMQLLDSNSDGSLSSDEFDFFQKQVEFIRSLENRDDQYKAILNHKLQNDDDSGLIQVYSEELGNRLAT